MRRLLVVLVALLAPVALAGPFHDAPSGPRALPGDTLPPFGMIDAAGTLPPPPPLPPGIDLAHLPPESTAVGPPPRVALALAGAAIRACAAHGARVGVAVVNAAGEARVLLNAEGTDGSHGFVAMRKALVALAFDAPSGAVAERAGHEPAVLAQITPAMFVEGGALPLHVHGRLIGAIGVSGAAGLPIGAADTACAAAALRVLR